MDPFDLTPAEKQRVVAEALRSQAVLGEAQRRGSRFDNLAAIAPLVNNPAVVNSATAAQRRAVAASKPDQLGNMGFMVDGQFAMNPAYIEDKFANRAQQRGLAAQRAQEQAERQRERLEFQAQQNAQNRALRGAIAQLAASNRAAGAADKADEKRNKDVDNYVFRLSNNLEKAGASEFGEAANIVAETLTKYKEGELPGFGRFGSLVPSAISSEEVQTTRANMQMAANILLKARSGAAVTNSEMNRFLTEVAMGKAMSEKALRTGWDNVFRTYGADLNNIMVGVPPEAVQEYEKRGGVDYRKMIKPLSKREVQGQVKDGPPQGVTPEEWSAMTPEERGLWKK